MKKMHLILTTVALCFCHSVVGQPVSEVPLNSLTNLFLNVEDFKFAVAGMQLAHIDTKKLEEARQSDESKPEAQDPKGNWGPPSEGLRMSLRFAKPAYTNGEPIQAIVLVRNISQQALQYPFYEPDWSLHFVVHDNQKHVLQDLHPVEPWGLGGKELLIFPGTQRRLIVGLDGHFNFESSGNYSIRVQARVPKLSGNGLSEATSGTATLKIVNPYQLR